MAEAQRTCGGDGGGGEAPADGAIERGAGPAAKLLRGVPRTRRHTMALFTDGAVASIEDLTGHDTQLLNVATVEDIDVTRKLALAQEGISVELAGLLEQAMQQGQCGCAAVDRPDRGDDAAQALACVPDTGNGLPRCVQQSAERPVCGQAGRVPRYGEVGVRPPDAERTGNGDGPGEAGDDTGALRRRRAPWRTAPIT